MAEGVNFHEFGYRTTRANFKRTGSEFALQTEALPLQLATDNNATGGVMGMTARIVGMVCKLVQ